MTKNVQKLHSIDSFGILKVSLSNIRIEALEKRIRPGVPFPHKHDFFQVMLVTEGSGWHQIDFKRHNVAKGQLFLMKPGQMHSWGLKKGVKGYIIEFNTESLNTLKISSRIMNDFALSPDEHSFALKKDFQNLVKLTEIMIDEFEKGKEMSDLCLQGYLAGLLIQIVRSYQAEFHHQKTVSIIEKFKELVEKNFRTEHSVEFYAKSLKIPSRALTMQFARSIGRPPRQIIQERILLEAKHYLAFSDLGIAEIGYELGFNDANYFTRFFREHEKKTPAQFKKLSLL